jgi:hypothetical protein
MVLLHAELFKDGHLEYVIFIDIALVINWLFAQDFYSKQLGVDECTVLQMVTPGQ